VEPEVRASPSFFGAADVPRTSLRRFTGTRRLAIFASCFGVFVLVFRLTPCVAGPEGGSVTRSRLRWRARYAVSALETGGWKRAIARWRRRFFTSCGHFAFSYRPERPQLGPAAAWNLRT